MKDQIHEWAFAVTGMPRSGTTYLCAVLHNPLEVIAFSEVGGQWKHLFKKYGKTKCMFYSFAEQRERILRGERLATF